jgi:hypothetical protein
MSRKAAFADQNKSSGVDCPNSYVTLHTMAVWENALLGASNRPNMLRENNA